MRPILIVEDSQRLSRSLKSGFEHRGFDVHCSQNGIDGWHEIQSNRYGVVILDMMLPGMAGNDILLECLDLKNRPKILVLSARDQVGDRVEAIHQGANDYLVKPFSFEELHARVLRLFTEYEEASKWMKPTSNSLKKSTEKIDVLNEFHDAMDRNQLELHYQPKCDLNRNKITGFEALLRWKYKNAYISPNEFMPLVEHSDLHLKTALWVVEKASQEIGTLNQICSTTYRVAVNITPSDLSEKSFASRVIQVLEENQFDPANFEVEITERDALPKCPIAIQNMSQLQEIGIHFSIDDFGTGFATLGSLMDYRFNTLKIDQKFIGELEHPRIANIVKSTLKLAQALELESIAEGVEHRYQLDWLRQNGCQYVQGYLTGKPAPIHHWQRLFNPKLAG